jgi:hypothetical protein
VRWLSVQEICFYLRYEIDLLQKGRTVTQSDDKCVLARINRGRSRYLTVLQRKRVNYYATYFLTRRLLKRHLARFINISANNVIAAWSRKVVSQSSASPDDWQFLKDVSFATHCNSKTEFLQVR